MRTLSTPLLVLLVGLLAVRLTAADTPATQPNLAPVAPNYTTATLTLIETPKSTTLPSGSASTATPAFAGLLDQWTLVHPADGHEIWKIAWVENAGGQFVAVGDNTVQTSPDGITWKTFHPGKTLMGVASNANLTVAVGNNGTIITSPDLKNWTNPTPVTTNQFYSVFWMGKEFRAFGDGGEMAASPDGLVWTKQPTSSTRIFSDGVWTGNEFVMGCLGEIDKSMNTTGRLWKNTGPLPGVRIFDIAWSGGLYVATSNTTMMYTSPDALTWTPIPVEGGPSVIWAFGQYIIPAIRDKILSSSDSINWTTHATGSKLDLRGIAAHTLSGLGDTVVIGTTTGAIFINKKLPQPAAPTITLAPGAPNSTPQVALTCATPGAKIFYTDDSNDPSSESTPYTAPFSPTRSGLIQARAFKDGQPPSDVAAAQFTIGTANP